MFVSGTSLFVVLSVTLLYLAKQMAYRGFYKEIQQPYRSSGWHNDPTRPDPRLVPGGDLQVWSSAADVEEVADTQRIS